VGFPHHLCGFTSPWISYYHKWGDWLMVRAPRFRVLGEAGIIVAIDGSPIRRKRQYIIEFLRQRGAEGAFVMEMYRGWENLCARIGKSPGSYENFRASMFQAKEKGIIEAFREEISDHNFNKVFYRLRVR